MNNRNMINPANYYNPFAQYNYVSKTRGVYIPKNTQPLVSHQQVKSASIYSEHYDAELDLQQTMASMSGDVTISNVKSFFKNLFF